MLEKCPNCGAWVLSANKMCPQCQRDRPGKFVAFACPECSQHIEAPTEGIGTLIACPTCTHQFAMPPGSFVTEPAEPKSPESQSREPERLAKSDSLAGGEGLAGFLCKLNENGGKHFAEFLNYSGSSGAERFGAWIACAASATVAEAADVLNRASHCREFIDWWQQNPAKEPTQSKFARVLNKPLWGGNSALREQGIEKMVIGATIFIIGAFVTFVTYSGASADGGHYIIAWGAMLIGALKFLEGLFQWFRG
jgi:hypothetical protein